jgi:hypothetical protein
MKIAKLLIASASLILPLTAGAAPITFDFTGTATIANGAWSGQGTAVTGSYTYDTALVPTVNSAITNTFLSNNAGNAGLGYNITIELGATSVSFDETDGLFNFGLFDKATDFYSFAFVGSGTNANLALFGSDPSAIENLDGSVPTSAPDLNLFQSVATAGRVGTQLKFTVDSITPRSAIPGGTTPVPEPSAALLFGVGAFVVGGAVKRRPIG